MSKEIPASPENNVETQDKKTLLNRLREMVNSKVASKFPGKEERGYESTMGIYGGTLKQDAEGRMVYDTRGFWNRIDQWGDRELRSFDEHFAKRPGELAMRHPKAFLKSLPFLVDSKRYRGTPEQTMENVKRLGLEEYYGAHPWGIEVKNPDVFSRSVGLQDIFRQDQIASPAIEGINRFDALAKATRYMKRLHETAGGIAEGNTYVFLFTRHEGNVVDDPILMIPTEIYNPEKNISEIEQKTTDLLDLMASVGIEEFRRTKDWESVKKALGVITQEYADSKVIHMVASYVKRGRLTLPGDKKAEGADYGTAHRATRPFFALHNTQRLSADSSMTEQLRQEIIAATEGIG